MPVDDGPDGLAPLDDPTARLDGRGLTERAVEEVTGPRRETGPGPYPGRARLETNLPGRVHSGPNPWTPRPQSQTTDDSCTGDW